ncbi:MAG: rhodanese-related sulfurtransferase [Pseudomonadota bacterium]
MFVIAALYHFAPVADPEAWCARLKALCEASELRGTLLIAGEGINGTVAGSEAAIATILAEIRRADGFATLSHKRATAQDMPFSRLKVRVKAEIVTMGQPGLDARRPGIHVAPQDWNALIAAPDVAVIDTRNGYETAIGTFEGAIDPQTESFRDFPDWWAANGHRFANKRIAMFCTGGIRCEKSTAYLRAQGVEEVYHLDGGILKYLEEVPEADSLWQGACFVFDERVSVGHGLVPGEHALCRACRRPVSKQDRAHDDYERGVQCPACVSEYSEADRARFRERQRQVDLAAAKGLRHIGN